MADSLPVRYRTQTGNVRPSVILPAFLPSLHSLRESNPPASPIASFLSRRKPSVKADVLFVVNLPLLLCAL